MNRTTSLRACTLVVLSLCITVAVAQRTIPTAHFLQLLEQGRYDQLRREAMAVRDTTYGRNYVVDWFIARAVYCSDHHEKAARWYRSIQRRYTMPREFKAFLAKELAACEAGSATCPPLLDDPGDVRMGRGAQWVPQMPLMASVHDKMGRIYRCDTPIPSDDLTEAQAELSTLLPVVAPGDTAALGRLRRTVAPTYRVDTAGSYVLLSRAGQLDRAAVKRALAKLEMARGFFLRTYGLRPPPYLITAGLVNGNRELADLGRQLHHLPVPGHVLGYSSVADMTMFGSASAEAVGTLYHELFHLLVRADVGDIPAWLDEGTASVYESAHRMADSLAGLYDYEGNFRLEMLRKASAYRDEVKVPRLEDLFDHTWEDFDGRPGESGCMPAVHYALAKHVCLWLQDTGRLVAMVQAHRDDLVAGADGIPVPQASSAIVERVVGMPMHEVQEAFSTWFQQRYGFALYGNER